MRRQVGRVVVAVAVLGAVMSGCGGPGQAGSAVIVGADSVPLERVQSQLDVALSRTEQIEQFTAQGGAPADIARSIVTSEVMHHLLQRQAAADGIVVTDADVDAELADSGGADAVLESSFYDMTTLRERVRDDLIAARLAEQSVSGLAVTADLVAVTSRQEADQKAATLAAGGPEADALFTDQRTSVTGMTYEAATAPDAAATVLFGTPVGDVVSFQPNPQQSTWFVFRVTDRTTGGPIDAGTASSISQSQLVSIGQRMLQTTGQELGIRVNPRYGVWDAIQMRVVAQDQQAGTILSPPAAG